MTTLWRKAISFSRSWMPGILLLLFYFTLCIPLIRSSRESNYANDEHHYHIPAIRQIAASWPLLDLQKDCLSATGPGYHYLLATIAQTVGTETVILRSLNWCIGALTLATIYFHSRKYFPKWDAVLWVMPLACSNFFIKSSSWVVTDNFALLLISLLLLCVQKPTERTKEIGIPILLNALITFSRQMNVWAIVLSPAANWPCIPNKQSANWRPFLYSVAGTLPAFGVVALFVFSWGGLVPPQWEEASSSFSTTGPIYALSVFGLCGAIYLGSRDVFSRGTLLAFSVGTLFAMTAPTTRSHEQGRWGGYLWNASDLFPSIGERNVLFIVLCSVGSSAAFLLWRELRTSNNTAARIYIIGLFAWLTSFIVNRQVFHRYFEPTILVMLIVYGALIPWKESQLTKVRLGLFVGSIVQLGITLATAHSALLR